MSLLPPTGRVEIIPPAGEAYRFEASPDLAAYLEDELELGVNVPPDTVQEVTIRVIWIGPTSGVTPRYPRPQ